MVRHRSVGKFLAKHGDVAAHWSEVEAILAENPYPRKGTLLIAPLHGKFQGSFRLMLWGYRFVFDVHRDKRVAYVYLVDTRGDVY